MHRADFLSASDQYQTYDVTKQINNENEILAVVAGGWRSVPLHTGAQDSADGSLPVRTLP